MTVLVQSSFWLELESRSISRTSSLSGSNESLNPSEDSSFTLLNITNDLRSSLSAVFITDEILGSRYFGFERRIWVPSGMKIKFICILQISIDLIFPTLITICVKVGCALSSELACNGKVCNFSVEYIKI